MSASIVINRKEKKRERNDYDFPQIFLAETMSKR